jgi:hypothetical protein
MAKKEMSNSDMAQDKKLIKKAIAMHDKQEHKGSRTDLSKLKKGGMAKMHKGGKTNEDMKSMGRGMAKVADQKSGTKG